MTSQDPFQYELFSECLLLGFTEFFSEMLKNMLLDFASYFLNALSP